MKLKHIKDRFDRIIINQMYDRQMNESIEKIKELKMYHKNERVFILGNGPSLNDTKFKLIKDEIFFVANAFHKGMKKFGIKPQYWAIGDGKIYNEYYKDIMFVDTNLFLTHQALYSYLKRPVFKQNEPYLVKVTGKIKHKPNFSFDITKGIHIGGGIIPIILQISFYLGFKEMYLLGCDCGSKGKPHHHFYKCKTQPRKDYSDIFEIYKICRDALQLGNRKIYNSTVGGNLEVFERVDLEEIS